MDSKLVDTRFDKTTRYWIAKLLAGPATGAASWARRKKDAVHRALEVHAKFDVDEQKTRVQMLTLIADALKVGA